MTGFLFDLISIIIIARVIMSLAGYERGGFYDFVYKISESILRPLRQILPASRIDWSPLVALLLLDLIKRTAGPVAGLAAQGDHGMIPLYLFYVIISLLSSVVVFFTILVIVRLVNDLVRGTNYNFTRFINAVTDPFVIRVRKMLPAAYRRYTVSVTLAILILIQILLGKIQTGIL